ncbi:MAG: ACT domain-containing protein, partial [Microthrixaceae bacterium]|nr:ACT domain-containing protein [Microthrixaceae bacterium]
MRLDGRGAVRSERGLRRSGRGADRERDRGHRQRHDRHAGLRRRPADPARAGRTGGAQLLAPRGAKLGDIKSVHSIPVATAQCRSWLRSNLGTVEHIAANSTAEAAATVANAEDPTAAAIGNRRAAEVYGLEVLGPDIEDHPENHTRFVVVGRDAVPAPTGHDKTSILVYQRADRPGSLLGILQEFAARGINLTLLLSRPTKKNLGDYCFLVDLEGHVDDEVVADCLGTLKATQADVKFLGSYPA